MSFSSIAQDAAVPGSSAFGELELRVTVVGRLVGSSASSVWSDYGNILGHADLDEVGTLDDGEGREWEMMRLLTVEADGPIDIGREVSLGYRAVFGRLTTG